MPFAVTKLPAEPIILVQFDLAETNREDSMRSVQDQINRTASETPAPLYVLVDLRRQDIHFSDILLMIEHGQSHPEGILTDHRLRIILVGDHPLLDIAVRKFNQAFGSEIGHTVTMDEALAWARTEINHSTPAATP
jgi:hypothetical protein